MQEYVELERLQRERTEAEIKYIKALTQQCINFNNINMQEKVNRIVNNNEPITDGAPIIFTEKKDGVLPEYNPRTDRWDIALTAMEKMDRARKAKKEQGVKPEDFFFGFSSSCPCIY